MSQIYLVCDVEWWNYDVIFKLSKRVALHRHIVTIICLLRHNRIVNQTNNNLKLKIYFFK